MAPDDHVITLLTNSVDGLRTEVGDLREAKAALQTEMQSHRSVVEANTKEVKRVFEAFRKGDFELCKDKEAKIERAFSAIKEVKDKIVKHMASSHGTSMRIGKMFQVQGLPGWAAAMVIIVLIVVAQNFFSKKHVTDAVSKVMESHATVRAGNTSTNGIR